MKTSQEVKNIFKAQIAMQSELKNIAKDSQGYGYKYTSLEKLIEYIKPILAKHGLGYIQTTTSTEDNKVGVTTRLIHESGEWIEDTMVAPLTKLAKMNEYQVAGSVITYFRRYALSAMIGIASDEDIDVNVAPQQPKKQQKPQQLTNMQRMMNILNNAGDKKQDMINFFLSSFEVEKLEHLQEQQVLKAIAILNKKGYR